MNRSAAIVMLVTIASSPGCLEGDPDGTANSEVRASTPIPDASSSTTNITPPPCDAGTGSTTSTPTLSQLSPSGTFSELSDPYVVSHRFDECDDGTVTIDWGRDGVAVVRARIRLLRDPPGTYEPFFGETASCALTTLSPSGEESGEVACTFDGAFSYGTADGPRILGTLGANANGSSIDVAIDETVDVALWCLE